MKFVKLAHCIIFSFFIVVFNLLHRINQIKFMFPHNTVISIQYHCIINKYTHSIISRTHWYPNINASLVRTCIWLHDFAYPGGVSRVTLLSRFVSVDKLRKISKKPDEFVHMCLVTQQFWDCRWLRIRATIWAAGTSPYPGILQDKRLDPIKALITSVVRPTCSPFLFLRTREFTHE